MKQVYLDSVIFSDIPFPDQLTRNFGAHAINNQIAQNGLTSCVVDFASSIDWNWFTKIVDTLIGEQTLFVGFSVTWFPYKNQVRRFLDGNDQLEGISDIDTLSSYEDGLSYNFSIGNSKKYVDYIKLKNPNIKVIVGGSKAYEYIDDEWFDNIFIGFSENQINDFILNLKTKTPIDRIINYDVKAQKGDYNFNSNKITYSKNDLIQKDDVLLIEFARGCIFNCAFCSWPLKGQDTRPYQKYQDTIRQELMENYLRWGVTKYAIADDTFNDHIEKLKLIKEVVNTLPFKPQFWCYARLDLIAAHPEMAQLMLDIGVVEVFYGIETWHDETAKIIRKGNRARKIKGMTTAREVWKDAVVISAAFVVGLPQDTKQSFEEFVEWHNNEGKYILDFVGMNPLYLRRPDHTYPYLFLSDIEKNLEQYGYSFNEHGWVRNDSGDISSRAVSEEVTVSILSSLDKSCVRYEKGGLDYTSHMHKIAGKEGLTNAQAVDLFARDKYFPNLIKSFDKYKRRMTGET